MRIFNGYDLNKVIVGQLLKDAHQAATDYYLFFE